MCVATITVVTCYDTQRSDWRSSYSKLPEYALVPKHDNRILIVRATIRVRPKRLTSIGHVLPTVASCVLDS